MPRGFHKRFIKLFLKRCFNVYLYIPQDIYQSLAIIVKRSEQINGKMKSELLAKLNEFATHSDELEEVFENTEQIEVSKFYERLPKPWAIAVKELLEDEVYVRDVDEAKEDIPSANSEEKDA